MRKTILVLVATIILTVLATSTSQTQKHIQALEHHYQQSEVLLNTVIIPKHQQKLVELAQAQVAQEQQLAQVQQQKAVEAAVAAPQAPSSKETLMAAAGIAQSDWGYVDYIISNESGWNPNATEPNSGAHGLPQALPYSKTGCGWSDAVCQLKWASGYAQQRYNGWLGAYNHWLSVHVW